MVTPDHRGNFMKLPYLEESHWPISKEPGERVVNPSYDKQIQDHLVTEFLRAVEKKDSSGMRGSLVELARSIKEELK